jgi:hypothetical protein
MLRRTNFYLESANKSHAQKRHNQKRRPAR